MRRPHWGWQDPLEAALLPAVSADSLMAHVRTIATWERESGSPGEAQAFDYIERTLKSLRRRGRAAGDRGVHQPAAAGAHAHPARRLVIEGLTHSFSTSVEALEAELVDVGDGRPEDLARAAGKIALVRRPGHAGRRRGPRSRRARSGQIFVLMDHLHNMIVTTDLGDARSPRRRRGSRPRRACRSSASTATRLRARLAGGPLRVRHDHAGAHRLDADPAPGRRAGRGARRIASSSSPATSTPGTTARWTTARANATMLEVARLLAARRRRAPARHPLRLLVGPLARALRGLGLVRGSRLARARTSAASCTSTWIRPARAAPPTTRCCHATEDAAALRGGGRRRRHRPAGPRAALLARGRSVVLGRRRALGVHVALGAAQAGHRSFARDGAAGRQRRLPVVVAHQGRHDRQDRRRRPGARHEGLRRLGAALAERAGAAARPRARRAGAARRAGGAAGGRRRALRSRPGARRRRAALGERLRAAWPPASRRSIRPRRPRGARRSTGRSCACHASLVPLAYTSGDRFTHDLALPHPAAGRAAARPASWRASIPTATTTSSRGPRSSASATVRVHALDSAASDGRRAAALEDRR